MSYFKNFPTITFNNKPIADITRRVKLTSLVQENALDYMSYTVEEGDTPEDVAYYYYDDASLAWLVLLSNDIIDPYSEWPKNQENLEKHIIAQYAEQSGLTGDAVLEWSKNDQIASNIVYYQSQYDPEITTNRATFVSLGNSKTIQAIAAVAGETYIIKSLGDLSTEAWRLFTNDSTYNPSLGDEVTAHSLSGIAATFASIQPILTVPSIDNPAREFYPIRAYDYEFGINEQRREIKLVNKGYLATIKDQLETILIDG